MNPDKIIQKYGVAELNKSPQGREVLAKAREIHKIDLIQPNDPKFERFYGKEVRAREELKRKNEDKAREMREKLEYENDKKLKSDRKKFNL